MKRDGHKAVRVASRFGVLALTRQVLTHADSGGHVMPGNAVLPDHEGMITTRGLQEWACLLPQELPFASVARLLGWQTHDAQILSASTLRAVVRAHGRLIRQAEQAEVAALREPDAGTGQAPRLRVVPHTAPRRRAGWPAELTAAVEVALVHAQVRPPAGVSWADWERVVAARRTETTPTAEELRHLGPEVGPDQVLLTIDEVLTRAPERRRFVELRTASVVTAEGRRYLSGVGPALVRQVQGALPLALAPQRSLLLIADGAHWIRTFFVETLADVPDRVMLLDWHHLRQKCVDLSGRICRGRAHKARFLRRLLRYLWCGDVTAARRVLEEERLRAKDHAVVQTLGDYLEARQAYIPNYRARRRACQYIGSGHVEKANDVLVARRQKGRGMHWSRETSDALAALRTLLLNGGWDLYWQDREVLPLVA